MLSLKPCRVAFAAPVFLLALANPAIAEPDLTPPAPPASVTTLSATAPETATAQPAKPAAPKVPAITLNADINLTTQQLTVTSGGKVLHVWSISSGRAGYDTPRGTFKPQWAARMHYSKKYDDAPMPHSVFFNGGVATHATYATGLLGRPASHGCVRLAPANAATFFNLVHKHGFASTRIVVHGSPRGRGDLVASRPSRERGESRARVAKVYPAPRYAYAQPGYGYPPGYGNAAPRRVYVMPRNGGYGEVRYLPAGYVRY